MDNMKNSNNFYLSGLIAFFTYFILLLLFSFYVISPQTKLYSFKDDSFEIELQVFENKPKEKESVKPKEEKIVKIEKKIEEPIKEESKEASNSNKKVDVKSLFANFKDNSKELSKEDIKNINRSIDPKRFKSKFEKEQRESIAFDRVFENNKTTTSLSNSENNNSDDEYLKEVNSLLSKWIPISGNKELKSLVIVSIDSLGNFSYTVSRKSGNEIFDLALDDFLKKQLTIKYPIPKKNSIKIEVEFKQKDKND
ncbi:hypothetical protein AAW29_00686 [Arcobacter porcinus]|uniref:Tol-Pal system subunit TolA n=2 Tax=Arcobacter porcinus TaxID=1935204 RepID=A0ABX2YDF9_9BACT|nr:hypothetical protein AAW30_00874 [Arcobacter porcinus]OCL83855.1 hypothetical protein AAW29_00686 [Arcobacter porcinus]OCL85877.1 hypothetical protein AAX30_01707 [Arcobacter porcinus]OCL92848.1 hypothetical protein AAX28_00388 [Arcobacter porcinus]